MKKIGLLFVGALVCYLIGYAQAIAKQVTIEGGDSIVLKTGKSSIVMKKDGTIVIKGESVSLEGDINAKGSSELLIKGSKIQGN